MKKLITLILFGLLTAITPLILSCGDEECCVCPSDPGYQEPTYHFIYSRVGVDYWVYTFNAKTGEAVDSVKYGDFPFWDVQFSKDGKYAYYSNMSIDDYCVWVADYASGDTLNFYQGLGGNHLSVSYDGDYLYASGRDVAIFSLPELRVIYSETQAESGPGCLNPTKNVAYMPTPFEESLTVIDFQTDTPQVQKIHLESRYGYPAVAGQCYISTDGKILFLNLLGSTTSFFGVQTRSTETFEILDEYGGFGGMGFVHPDGKRVFYCYPRTDGGIESEVWVLNIRERLMEKVLDTYDFWTSWPSTRLSFWGMDFTPDGRFAFILGGGGFGYGPIVKLDLDTYRVVDMITPPGGVSRLIRMYPLEIKGG